MSERLADLLIRHRHACLLLVLLMVGVAGYGARFLAVSIDYRTYFGPDNPQLRSFNALQDQYARDDNILVALAPADGVVFSAEFLHLVDEFTTRAWETPHSLRVDSVNNYQYSRGEGDELIVEPLVENPLNLEPAELVRRREIALAEPVLRDRLINPDASVTGINITINLPGREQAREVFEAVGFVRDLVAELSARHPGVGFHLTGQTMLNAAFPEVVGRDVRSLYPLSVLLVTVMLGVFFHRVWTTLLILAVVILAGVAGMGAIGYAGVRLAPATVGAPVMIMTLAVANCVHILVSYYQAMERFGDRVAAMGESLRLNLQPVFLTSVTTATGFLSLNFSDSPPFRVMGNMVCVGVLFAFLLSVMFLPALATLLPAGKVRARVIARERMGQFADFVIRERRRLFAILLVASLALTCAIPLNEFNDNSVDFFHPDIPFRADTEFIDANLTGISSINYSLYAGRPDGVTDPAYLETVERFTGWLRAQDRVVHVLSFSDVMKRLNRNLHGDDPDWYRLPDDQRLASQYLLLYELSLPFGLDLNNQVSFDRAWTKVTVSLRKSSAKELIAMDEAARDWLRANAPEYMWTEGASPNLMFAHITERNVRSMLLGLFAALVVISGILMLALRSLHLGLVSLVPNLLPIGVAFGVWGLVSGQVGLGLSVVMGMTIGIVVDDTVHFLSKYLHARRRLGYPAPDAVRYAFETVGIALVATTLVLSLGFMVLTTSKFNINVDIGQMTAITLVLAFLLDFLFLPPLLLMTEKTERNKDGQAAIVDPGRTDAGAAAPGGPVSGGEGSGDRPRGGPS